MISHDLSVWPDFAWSMTQRERDRQRGDCALVSGDGGAGEASSVGSTRPSFVSPRAFLDLFGPQRHLEDKPQHAGRPLCTKSRCWNFRGARSFVSRGLLDSRRVYAFFPFPRSTFLPKLCIHALYTPRSDLFFFEIAIMVSLSVPLEEDDDETRRILSDSPSHVDDHFRKHISST